MLWLAFAFICLIAFAIFVASLPEPKGGEAECAAEAAEFDFSFSHSIPSEPSAIERGLCFLGDGKLMGGESGGFGMTRD